MILQQKARDIIEIGSGEESHKMHISKEAENHLIRMATEWSYKAPLESALREGVSNAVDSHLEAGVKEPVIVSLKKQITGQWILQIIDVGLGLDDVSFKKYIMGLGESTKRNNPNLLGGYGSGSKSFCSYTNSYEYLCRKDGIERKYLIVKGEEVPEDRLLWEKPTEERNGVIVSVTLKNNYDEFNNCIKAIKEQLSYLDNIYYDIPNFDNSFKIFRNDLFEWNSLHTANEMHISLKSIYYPLNWHKLGISRINIPIALRFDNYDDLQPMFNREELIWNGQAKEAILRRIKQVSEWMVNRYNENVKEFPSLLKAWPFINVPDKNVELNGKEFKVNELEQYSSVKFNDIKIKGVEFNKPTIFKQGNRILDNYEVVGEYSFYDKKMAGSGYIGYCINNPSRKSMLLHEEVKLAGFFRDYLKTLGFRYFVKYKPKNRNLKWYKTNIELGKDKKLWRKKIEEWQRVEEELAKELFTDGTKIHESQAFLDYKEEMKAKPEYKAKSKRLDKQQGQVTIAYQKEKRYGGWSFDKQVYNIQELYKKPFISVILTEEESESIDQLVKIYKKQKIKFCIVGKKEQNKIPKLHNFMTTKQLEKTRIFGRIATALRGKKALETYEAVTYSKLDIVKSCLGKLHKLKSEVEKYANSNLNDIVYVDKKEIEMLLAVAEQGNLWDSSFIHKVKEFENSIQDYDFLTILKEPKEQEDFEEYSKLINSFLLFKKLKYPEKFPNLEICVAPERDETEQIMGQTVGQYSPLTF